MEFSLTDKHRDIFARVGGIGRGTIRPSAGRYQDGVHSPLDTFGAFEREGLVATIHFPPGNP